jgi:hypothetical protein
MRPWYVKKSRFLCPLVDGDSIPNCPDMEKIY